MSDYQSMDKNALESELKNLKAEYEDYKAQGLKLNMARGVPSTAQLELSLPMLDILKSGSDCLSVSGADCRNYGILDGIDEAKELFAQMLGVKPENVFIGGNSSLNMMFDTIACFSENGVAGEQPWLLQGKIKFLCPAPGYDRHFGVTGFFKNIEMITIPMTENGPDMDMVEKYVENDSTVKGIWCVPKYSNPDGITYSDETVKRFAALKPAAKDFRIMWDNAYCIHDLTDTPDTLLNLYDECLKNGNEDLPIMLRLLFQALVFPLSQHQRITLMFSKADISFKLSVMISLICSAISGSLIIMKALLHICKSIRLSLLQSLSLS